MRNYSQGFTYFGILLTIALLGSSLSAVGASWAIDKRRAAEADLIYVGQAYRRAIASYYKATPRGVHEYPRRLADLLEDRRGPKLLRHIREIYPDPLTGHSNWTLVRLPDGAVVGVASQAQEKPMKRGNFGDWEASFESATCYCDWKFVYLPELVGGSPVTP